MSAIYQQARPTTFAQVVGQEHVKSVLTAAIGRDRTGHAYLFSGPRGVGKTTTARLLAMAVNCDGAEGVERPCGVCESCRLIQRSSHPDVTELDAASNNSVEDVRDLREKVRLASIRGGTRVWILDEAHMLSRAAANALLKTLEEPPPGLVFVLATTEPEKLPPTILSRCQHFRFRRLADDEIRGKLERLCGAAGVEAEGAALALVARAADGAMRDGESLLERLLTPGATITLADAEAALGLPPRHRLERLATALVEGELGTLLGEAGALYRDGFAPRTLAEQLARTLRDALVQLVAPERAARENAGEDSGESGSGFRLPLEPDALLRLIHALDDELERFSRRDDLYALEAALLKSRNALTGNAPAEGAAAPLLAPAAPSTGAPSAGAPAAVRPPAQPSAPPPTQPSAAAGGARSGGLPDFDPHGSAAPPSGRAAPPAAGSAAAAAPGESGGGGGDGSGDGAPEPKPLNLRLVKARASAQLKAFLMPAAEEVEGQVIHLRYRDTHRFHFNELKKRGDELVSLVEAVGGAGYTVLVEGPGDPARWLVAGGDASGGGGAAKKP